LHLWLCRGAIVAAFCCSIQAATLSDAIQKQPIRQARASSRTGILYHGGPVMAFGVNVYYIWYGNWSSEAESAAIVTALAQGIGGTPYFNVNSTYRGTISGRDMAIANTVRYAGSVHDDYSQGARLGESATPLIVQTALAGGKLPADPNGIYFVLGSPDTTESVFCKTSCGWHGWGTLLNGRLHASQALAGGIDIKYAFIGNPKTQCLVFCSLFGVNFPPPNGNAGADAMTSVIAHEMSEVVNDPHMDAWFDLDGDESADKCQWSFGVISRVPVGQPNSYAVYNVSFGGRNYLLQQNWVNASGGYCAMEY